MDAGRAGPAGDPGAGEEAHLEVVAAGRSGDGGPRPAAGDGDPSDDGAVHEHLGGVRRGRPAGGDRPEERLPGPRRQEEARGRRRARDPAAARSGGGDRPAGGTRPAAGGGAAAEVEAVDALGLGHARARVAAGRRQQRPAPRPRGRRPHQRLVQVAARVVEGLHGARVGRAHPCRGRLDGGHAAIGRGAQRGVAGERRGRAGPERGRDQGEGGPYPHRRRIAAPVGGRGPAGAVLYSPVILVRAARGRQPWEARDRSTDHRRRTP